MRAVHVPQEGMSLEALKTFTTKVCSFPSFFNQALHEKILSESRVGAGAGLVSTADAAAWWSKCCENKCPGERLWGLLRSPNAETVTREDWKRNLASLLDTHPGLEFLKSTPEFQVSTPSIVEDEVVLGRLKRAESPTPPPFPILLLLCFLPVRGQVALS